MDTIEIIKKAAEKGTLERIRYLENNVPTSMSSISVLPFFGDLRSTLILSAMLLKRYREEAKGSKYFILCSWPGYEGLFPYVDEYWTIKDKSLVKIMASQTKDFSNNSETFVSVIRNLNHFFEDVLDPSLFEAYYDKGIKQEFWNKFKHIKRYFPSIPSVAIMGPDFSRELSRRSGYKIFLEPSTHIRRFHNKQESFAIPKEFWVQLVQVILNMGMVPVVYKTINSYDISDVFVDKCVYVNEENILKILGVMRFCDCVLDVFNGLSRLAIIARTPYVVCDERTRFNIYKEYELDDLFSGSIPREYIFSFPTIIDLQNKGVWGYNILDIVANKLRLIVNDVDKNTLPVTSETMDIVPYSVVRNKKNKKFGTKFIKVPIV